MYQARFLHGLGRENVIESMSSLAQAPLLAHPIYHQAIHINCAPDDISRHVVDDWHVDQSVSFEYVMMVSDPRPMKGGRFEYFRGSQPRVAPVHRTGARAPFRSDR